MKKLILLGIIMMTAGSNIQAQNVKIDVNKSDTEEKTDLLLREKLDKYASQVYEIVVEEQAVMQFELLRIDKDVESGTISMTQAADIKEEIALKSKEKINQRIKSLNFELDELTRKQTQFSIMNTETQDVEPENKEEKKSSAYKRKNQLVAYLAYGALISPNGSDKNLNKHLKFSNGIDFGFLYHFQPTKTSPVVLMTGAYFAMKTLRFSDNRYVSRSIDGDVELTLHPKHLTKSKLRATYITVPLGLKYSFSKTKDDQSEPYRNPDKGFSISLNAFGGFWISNTSIVKGDDVKYRDNNTDFGLNSLIYGGQVTLGINEFGVYFRQEINPYFKDNHFDNRQTFQVGLQLSF